MQSNHRTPTGSSQHWRLTSPQSAASTPHKNTVSQMHYMDFYLHYKKALLAEGYLMSAFDNCLFYRITPTETTYIIVYVDDTFIFSNSQANIDAVITNVAKHYEVTLDREATSFLGPNLAHNDNNTVTITQPKLLIKLFALNPPRKYSAHKPNHPNPPLPKHTDPPPQPADHYAYLRILGILLYLTKSRPDIMAAFSFAGTKSSSPTDKDLSDLYYVVEYLHATHGIGHILHRSTLAAPVSTAKSTLLISSVSTAKSTLLISSTRTAKVTLGTIYLSMAQLAPSTTAVSSRPPSQRNFIHSCRSPRDIHLG